MSSSGLSSCNNPFILLSVNDIIILNIIYYGHITIKDGYEWLKIGKHELYRYILPLMNTNMYMMISNKHALVIDPMKDEGAFERLVGKGVDEVTVILTHEHFDHISGVNSIRNLMINEGGRCEVYANACCADYVKSPDMNLARFFQAMFITRPDDERKIAGEIFDVDYSCEVDCPFNENITLNWEDITLALHNTPGHSPGSICIEMYNKEHELIALATGDSLVEGNTVITRLPRGNRSDYTSVTLPYLKSFSPDVLVLPGHGEVKEMKDLVLG